MPLPSGFKTREEYNAYMREYRKRKKAEAAKKKLEDEKHAATVTIMLAEARKQGYHGITLPVSVIEEEMRKRGIDVATDSVASKPVHEEPLTRLDSLGIDEDELYTCMLELMTKGYTEEKAREKCEAELLEKKKKGEPKDLASDSLGVVGREATPLERCMSCRMDIYGESEEVARRTCTKMFNDPMMKHAFTEGDGEAMGVAFHKWDLKHSPKWQWYRDREISARNEFNRMVDLQIRELRKSKDRNIRLAPEFELRKIAEKKVRRKLDANLRKTVQELRDTKVLTVGSTYGKTREQIIAEDHKPDTSRSTVGDVYGKKKRKAKEKE